MADNTITVVGNLTRDPELRFTTGGRGVASFGIAVGRRYQVNGEWQEQTSYFNITAWGTLGENAAATLTKGSRVIVMSSANTPTAMVTSAPQSRSSLMNSDRACVGQPRKSSAHRATAAAAAEADAPVVAEASPSPSTQATKSRSEARTSISTTFT